MKFWDASALIPLLLRDPFTARAQELALNDAAALVWWGSRVECASAIARREREGQLGAEAAERAWQRLRQAATMWTEVEPGERIRATAERFLRVHPLRAADALQLAAAWAAGHGDPTRVEIVSFDERLQQAARREGFRVCGAS